MATIRRRIGKDGKAHYQAQVRVKGNLPQSATFRRRTDAKNWAQTVEATLRSGKYLPTAEERRKTVGDLVRRFAEEKLPERAKRDQPRLRRQLEWWGEQLGWETQLQRVTPAAIVEVKDRLAHGASLSGSSPSPATVKRYLAILSRAFSVAVKEWFWLQESPCGKVPRPTEPRGRLRFLDDEERERLLEACRKSSNQRLYPLVLAAITTGARRSELLSLRWRSVDFDRGLAVIEDSKNGDRRSVPLVGPITEVLLEKSKVRQIKSNAVFADGSGRVTFPRRAWEAAVRKADLDNFNFHDLRHTAASYLAMSGATLAEIAEILGHKTLQMVKRYAHLTDQHSHRVASRMADRYLAEA